MAIRARKPLVFIGSSAERRGVAKKLAVLLKGACTTRPWYGDDVFPPGSYAWEAIENAIRDADFAVFIFSGDDITRSRHRQREAPRDNVILEAGLALGMLGRARAYILYSKREQPKLPTDLLNLTYVPYTASPSGIKKAAGSVRKKIAREGPKDNSETIVPYELRASYSARVLMSAIDCVDSFCGDLTWFRSNFAQFAALRRRHVRVRFLTKTRTVQGIVKAKKLGMQFRKYAKADVPPLKGSVIDYTEESRSRALVVGKLNMSTHLQLRNRPYNYSMISYRGPRDHAAIKAMAALFERLWTAGRPF